MDRFIRKRIAALATALTVALSLSGTPVWAEPAEETIQPVQQEEVKELELTVEDIQENPGNPDEIENPAGTDIPEEIEKSENPENPDIPVDEEEQVITPVITWTVTPEATVEISYSSEETHDSLTFAVWSTANGLDDLTWNKAESVDGKAFTCAYDVKNLKDYGTVAIHVYTSDNLYLEGTTIDAGTPSIGKISVENKDAAAGTCTIVLSEITHPELIGSVTVPIWSDPQQADIVWYNAVKKTGATLEDLTFEVPFQLADHNNNLGTYHVHAYMKDTLDNQSLQVNTKVEFGICGTVVVNATASDNIYEASVTDVAVPGGYSKLRFAVWSRENGQDDLKWYTAEDGKALIDLKDYRHMGEYIVHAYVTLAKGSEKKLGEGAFFPEVSGVMISLGKRSGDGKQPVIVKNIGLDNVKELRAAIWSRNKGQDDLQWYTGSAVTNGAGEVTINMHNHKEPGEYIIHVYALTNNGKMHFLGSTEDLVLDASNSVLISVADAEPEEGTFTVKVEVPDWGMAVSAVKVPVWCAADQSDIVWYKANRLSDGSYQVKVKSSNHQNHAGEYQAHVYVTYVNKQTGYVGRTKQQLNPSSLTIENTAGKGKRTILIRNCEHAASVQVPIWSSDNGQDDIVWYRATKNSSGIWQVTMDVADHRNSGKFYVHVYADGKLAANDTFEIAYSEVKTEYTELAGSMNAAKNNRQLILVAASGTTAQVTMLNKNSDGSWFQLLTSSGYVGRNGIGPTTEWSVTTPVGVYGFTKAFGIYGDPGTEFSYVKVDSSYYWVDDVNSKYYNKFVTTKTTVPDWSSAEHIIDYTGSYNYCLAIDYNPECTPGVGSAIFLHCSVNRATGGCVAVPESVMKKILQLVHTDCKIVISTKSGLAAY